MGEPTNLQELVRDRRIVVTVGSGGVGKTTTAAAIALHAAMAGRKVLCLTIDPARRLANSLGLEEMRASEQEVPKELFEAQGLNCPGSLSVMMLDTKRTFDELVARHASTEEIRDKILNNDIYNYVAGSLAGTQEYMAMEKLHEVRQDPRFDLIVLDTPPTSNALDFLDAPERMVAAIDSPAMRWFIQAFEGAGRFSFGMLGKGATVLLKGLSRFTGAGFLEQIAEFVSGLNDLFGGFQARAAEVAGALRSTELAFVVVTSPAPMAVQEALYFSDRLRGSGMRRDAVVMNGVQPLLPDAEGKSSELEAALRDAIPDADAPVLLDKLRRALRDQRQLALADRHQADGLHSRVKDEGLFIEVPKLEEDVHDLPSLAKVAGHLAA